jgi:hypothetical protein
MRSYLVAHRLVIIPLLAAACGGAIDSTGTSGSGETGGAAGGTGGAAGGTGGAAGAVATGGHGGLVLSVPEASTPDPESNIPTCYADFPCFGRQAMCVGTTHYQELISHDCHYSCGPELCSGGSCDPVGNVLPCGPGLVCREVSLFDAGNTYLTTAACVPDPDAGEGDVEVAYPGDGGPYPSAGDAGAGAKD